MMPGTDTHKFVRLSAATQEYKENEAWAVFDKAEGELINGEVSLIAHWCGNKELPCMGAKEKPSGFLSASGLPKRSGTRSSRTSTM